MSRNARANAVVTRAEPGAEVTLQRFKYGGIPHYRHVGRILGSDDRGTWLSLPPQPLTRGGEHVLDVTWWTLQLVPEDGGWWAAFFEEDVGSYDLYVDVCTGSTWTGATVTMIDLDLDVVRYRADGSVAVIDHDDLERHAVMFDYPAQLIQQAHVTAARLLEAVTEGRSPFDGSARSWMERLRGGRPPK